MSQRIDHDRPYTEEDKQYLLTRANGRTLIQINERRFGHLEEDEAEARRKQAEKDAEIEAAEAEARRKAQDADDEDAYHPDDLNLVEQLTIAQMRDKLEKLGLPRTVSEADQNPGEGTHFTEKQVLAYRLLDHLDAQRNQD